MYEWDIHSKKGTDTVEAGGVLTTARKLEYNGTYMGDRHLSVELHCPAPVQFGIGDYIDYNGERYSLAVLPTVEKVARTNSYGGAYNYQSIQFVHEGNLEMERCMMLDIVTGDNNLHYTSLPTFSFYCSGALRVHNGQVATYSEGLWQVANRLQANLNRTYGTGIWTVSVSNNATINDTNLSVSNQSCWDFLANAANELDINFSLSSTISGGVVRHTLTIGTATSWNGKTVIYGKGNQLITLERSSDERQQIITRLMAYGSTRNIPYRYYNYLWYRVVNGSRVFIYHKLDAGQDDATTTTYNDGTYTWTRVCNPAIYVPNLMLPMFRQNGSYAYIDSSNINSIGIHEGVKFFDGSDDKVDDIYPSITGMTNTDLYNAYTADERYEQNIHSGNAYQGNLDEVVDATQVDFSGLIPEEQTTAPTFDIYVMNLGFNPGATELKSSDTPKVEMKSGMCAGRGFEIKSCSLYKKVNGTWTPTVPSDNSGVVWFYRLTCEVAQDMSINRYFPNTAYQLAVGDKFVLTGIMMPDVYVRAAEQRLLTAARAYLTDNSKTRYTYTPRINNIYYAQNPSAVTGLKEGTRLSILDSDLEISERRTISNLVVRYGTAQIPEYEITMSDEVEASLAQRVTAEIDEKLGNYVRNNVTTNSDYTSVLQTVQENYLSKTTEDTAIGPIEVETQLRVPMLNSIGYGTRGFMVNEDKIEIRDMRRSGGTAVTFTTETQSFTISNYVNESVVSITKTLQYTAPTGTAGSAMSFVSYYSGTQVAIKNATLTVTHGDNEVQVLDSNNGTHQFNLSQGLDTYVIKLEVRYSHRSQIEGGIVLRIEGENGDGTTNVSVPSENYARVATISPEKIELYSGGSTPSGWRFRNKSGEIVIEYLNGHGEWVES